MPRDLPLANGHLLVNFDATYTLRDVYWPHVGERNQTLGHLNRCGVWADGTFAWLNDDGWERTLLYEDDTLVTDVVARHAGLRVTLHFSDAVDFDRDILIRRVEVTNDASDARDIRLFFHHDWHLWENEGANTVYFHPDLRALVAYKDLCCIVVNGLCGGADAGAPRGQRQADEGVHRWATGYKEFNAQQGTWKDAEDGELGGNPIAQGSVDSCVGFELGEVGSGATRTCYHWLAAARDFRTARDLNEMVLDRGPGAFIVRTRNYWRVWSSTKPLDTGDLPTELVNLYRRNLLIIRTQIDDDGAILAATDGDVWSFSRDSYAYMWPRDGALVANALSHSGYGDITSAFFHFCSHVITRRGYLLHKFTPTGALGSSWHPWIDAGGNPILPIQEDETALVVYALWQHYSLFHEVEFVRPLYRPLVKAAADFMASYREPHTGLPHASWDLWEERRGIHAYTVAAVYAGLMAAAQFADLFGEDQHANTYRSAAEGIRDATRAHLWNEKAGRFVRMVTVAEDGSVTQDMTLDASMTGLCQFGMFPAESDEIRQTMEALEARLTIKTRVGGIARYENDYYHQVSKDIANVPGNPWFICACWLAEYRIARAQTVEQLHEALELLEWVRARALPSGVLAEQVNPYSDAPLSVSPLTWSHAEFVAAIRWYAGKHRKLQEQSATAAPFAHD